MALAVATAGGRTARRADAVRRGSGCCTTTARRRPTALDRLLDAARRSPSVGIAGPKLTTWADDGRLLEVGRPVTRTGRRAGGPAAGEPDQGQHDHRTDVLAVASSGMLVRRDVFDALGGFEPAFAPHAEDVDLCWRAHLAGHRVVVVPQARVREGAAAQGAQRAGGGDPRRRPACRAASAA